MSLLRFQKKFRTSCKNRLFSTAGLLAFRRRKPACIKGFRKCSAGRWYVYMSCALLDLCRCLGTFCLEVGRGRNSSHSPLFCRIRKAASTSALTAPMSTLFICSSSCAVSFTAKPPLRFWFGGETRKGSTPKSAALWPVLTLGLFVPKQGKIE